MFRQTVLPRWKGFNLLGCFNMSSPGYFEEEEFQIVSDLGFDYVRLPLNYTFWIDENDPFRINEKKLEKIDEAVRWGEKYGIHVNLALHRAPGYSVAEDRREPFDLWTDREAQDCFIYHWTTLAERYKGIGNDKLSFNLVNEPSNISAEAHRRVMRPTVEAIHQIHHDRLIFLDGMNYGTIPCTDMADLAKVNVAQSCRAYIPSVLTHYKAEWMPWLDNSKPVVWPGMSQPEDGIWDDERIYRYYQGWAAIAQNFNMGVHCGEGGCYNKTPHDVMLNWFETVLSALKDSNIGIALWNLKGEFGILNSGRTDVQYEDYRGYKLDKKLLELMRKY